MYKLNESVTNATNEELSDLLFQLFKNHLQNLTGFEQRVLEVTIGRLQASTSTPLVECDERKVDHDPYPNDI